MGGASVPLILLERSFIMGQNSWQSKKARQLGASFIVKTASATITRREILTNVTIQAEKATAMTLTMPATDTELANVDGEIINAGAGVATVSYTAQSGVRTVTLNQGDKASYLYDEDGKCYLDTADEGTEIVSADPGTTGALAIKGSVALTSGAGAETRTLAIPAKAGDQLSITMDVDGGGDITATVAASINTTGNNTLLLDTAGGNIVLIGAQVGGALTWRVVANDAVTLSTV
jgi:hypothetical protein